MEKPYWIIVHIVLCSSNKDWYGSGKTCDDKLGNWSDRGQLSVWRTQRHLEQDEGNTAILEGGFNGHCLDLGNVQSGEEKGK